MPTVRAGAPGNMRPKCPSSAYKRANRTQPTSHQVTPCNSVRTPPCLASIPLHRSVTPCRGPGLQRKTCTHTCPCPLSHELAAHAAHVAVRHGHVQGREALGLGGGHLHGGMGEAGRGGDARQWQESVAATLQSLAPKALVTSASLCDYNDKAVLQPPPGLCPT